MSCNVSFGANEMWISRGEVCVILLLIARVVARAGMTSFHTVCFSLPSNLRESSMTSHDYLQCINVIHAGYVHFPHENRNIVAVNVRRVHDTSVSTCMRGWA